MLVLLIDVLAHGVCLRVDGAQARNQSLCGVVMGTRVAHTPCNFSSRVFGRLGVVPDTRSAVDKVRVPALRAGSRDRCRAPLGRQRNNGVVHQPQHDVQTDAAEKMVRAQAVVYTSVRYLVPVHLAPVSQTCASLVTDWNALFKPPKVPRDRVLVGQDGPLQLMGRSAFGQGQDSRCKRSLERCSQRG